MLFFAVYDLSVANMLAHLMLNDWALILSPKFLLCPRSVNSFSACLSANGFDLPPRDDPEQSVSFLPTFTRFTERENRKEH